jgi:glycosyltransferase involved in cell wall biosynthesis
MNELSSFFLPRFDNPYQKELIANLESFGVKVKALDKDKYFLPFFFKEKPNILHLHLLYTYFMSANISATLITSMFFLSQLIILKLIGVKIVWTAHDLNNHHQRYLKIDRLVTKIITQIADAIIVHGKTAKVKVIKTFSIKNQDKIFVIPHGNYLNNYKNVVKRTEARKILDIPDTSFVLLLLGRIQPYKGVFELIDSFQQWHDKEAKLIIAGQPSNENITQIIQQKIGEDPHIKFIPRFIPDEEIQIYMNACDAVVLPYRDILTSGSVVLAMSFARACIAPKKGCIEDMLDRSGAFLYEPDDNLGLIKAMNDAMQRKDELKEMGKHNLNIAREWNWDFIAKMTFEAYQFCLYQ